MVWCLGYSGCYVCCWLWWSEFFWWIMLDCWVGWLNWYWCLLICLFLMLGFVDCRFWWLFWGWVCWELLGCWGIGCWIVVWCCGLVWGVVVDFFWWVLVWCCRLICLWFVVLGRWIGWWWWFCCFDVLICFWIGLFVMFG